MRAVKLATEPDPVFSPPGGQTFLRTSELSNETIHRSVTQQLIILALPPSWNTFYSGKHWGYRKSLAEEWHTLVAIEARRQAISPVHRAHLTYRCTFTFGRGIDVDNLCVKILTDGLVHAGILPNDGPNIVPQVTIRTERGPRKETIIFIEEM